MLAGGGERAVCTADVLFALIGAQPHTRWLPATVARGDRGYVLTGEDIPGHLHPPGGPLPYQTSAAGVSAVGDVRHGSVKRVASAVGEGAVCISSVHRHLTLQRCRAVPMT